MMRLPVDIFRKSINYIYYLVGPSGCIKKVRLAAIFKLYQKAGYCWFKLLDMHQRQFNLFVLKMDDTLDAPPIEHVAGSSVGNRYPPSFLWYCDAYWLQFGWLRRLHSISIMSQFFMDSYRNRLYTKKIDILNFILYKSYYNIIYLKYNLHKFKIKIIYQRIIEKVTISILLNGE